MVGEKGLKWIKEIYATEKLDGWKVEMDKIGEEWRVKIVIYRKDWQHPFEWNAWFSEFKEEIPFSLFKKVAIYEAFKLCFAEELEKFEERIPEKEVSEEIEEGLKRKLEERVKEEEVEREKESFKEEFLEEKFYQEHEESLYERSFESLEEKYLDKETISEEQLGEGYESESEVKFEEKFFEEPEVSKIYAEEIPSKELSFQQITSREFLKESFEEHPRIKKPAKITLEQMQLIAKLLPNKSHKQRLKKISRIIGREVNTYGEISYEEAERVIRELQGVRG